MNLSLDRLLVATIQLLITLPRKIASLVETTIWIGMFNGVVVLMVYLLATRLMPVATSQNVILEFIKLVLTTSVITFTLTYVAYRLCELWKPAREKFILVFEGGYLLYSYVWGLALLLSIIEPALVAEFPNLDTEQRKALSEAKGIWLIAFILLTNYVIFRSVVLDRRFAGNRSVEPFKRRDQPK